MQVAYTIKELREMLKLPGVDTIWRSKDFEGENLTPTVKFLTNFIFLR